MSDSKALSQQLLHTHLQTPARLDILDVDVENLAASHNQLSVEVRDAREAQKDAASQVQILSTHLHDSAVARLINTTELLEMILLEVVDLSPDVDKFTERESCGEHCGEKCVEYWGDIPCEAPSTFTYSKTAGGRGMSTKIDEKARRLRTLLLARRISKCFRATIDGSLSLQQALFLTPNPPACAPVRINWLYLSSQLYHKIAWKKTDGEFRNYIVPETSNETLGCRHIFFDRWWCGVLSCRGHHKLRLEWKNVNDGFMQCECAHGDCDLRASPTFSSWKDMHFSQPPLPVQWGRYRSELGRSRRPTTISSFFPDV